MSKFDDAVLHDLANLSDDLPSRLARLALKGQPLTEQQNAVISRAIAGASECVICGEYAGFGGDEYCERHSE